MTIDYQQARPHIKSGDLIAYESQGFFAWCIRRVTATRFTHVGIACQQGRRLMLLESSERHGVHMRALSKTGNFTWFSTGYPLSWAAFEFWQDRVGYSKYDWPGIAANAIGRAPERNDQFICSEFSGEQLMLSGYPLTPADMANPGTLTTALLYNGARMYEVINPVRPKRVMPRWIGRRARPASPAA